MGANSVTGGGEWLSASDLVVTTNPSSSDFDHFIPLKEARDSAACNWSAAEGQAFANDLGIAGSLIAVSDSTNRSKGDKDPALWIGLPISHSNALT